MRKPAKAIDMIERMRAKTMRDAQMAKIKADYAPWADGEWDEFRATLNQDKAGAQMLVDHLAPADSIKAAT